MQKILLTVLLTIFTSSAFAKTYDLEIKKQDVFITGEAVEAITINGGIPGPTLRFKEGEDVVMKVKNSMDEVTGMEFYLMDQWMAFLV